MEDVHWGEVDPNHLIDRVMNNCQPARGLC
jgi:hypothetical protein